MMYNLLLNVNTTVTKTWNQYKRTDQSIVTNEIIISSVVNSSSNLTIDYTVNVPTKEGYGLIEGIQRYDDFLPIRISYWFLEYPNNNSCYSQGNYSVALVEPYCQPLTAYTVSQIETQINFTVEMRPSLPAGTYSLVRSIDIDPNNVWIEYGQEIIGSIIILGESNNPSAHIKNTNSIALEDKEGMESETEIVSNEKIGETDGITGLATGNALDPLNISMIISLISLMVVIFLSVHLIGKKSPWGY
ncbi:MAG: hypothetical protein JXC85_06645 [Candidatus Aenigmarchaeota archaeon]|nr:hypothetical protein [Candidatus Aenigmarchaeota archaeon]